MNSVFLSVMVQSGKDENALHKYVDKDVRERQSRRMAQKMAIRDENQTYMVVNTSSGKCTSGTMLSSSEFSKMEEYLDLVRNK